MGNQDDAGRSSAYSRLPTKEDLKRICAALEKAGVKYVLVGGMAVGFHGRPRMTHDIDLLVDPSPQNVAKIKEALSCLPDNAAQEVRPEDVQNYGVVRIADEVVVDLIGKIGDITADNAGVEVLDLEGTRVRVADLETLIKTKQGLRQRDREDLLFLLEKQRRGKKP